MTAVPVRVVLAADHPMYRYGVAAVLATADEIELVGEASDGGELIVLVDAERPTWCSPISPCPASTERPPAGNCLRGTLASAFWC
jgi:hypothetical protein